MAYLVELVLICATSGCRKRVQVEVRNHQNTSQGWYCRVCGERLVKRLTDNKQ